MSANTTHHMTPEQFDGFMATVPPGARIERSDSLVTVSAKKHSTGLVEVVFTATRSALNGWDVAGPAQLFIKTVSPR